MELAFAAMVALNLLFGAIFASPDKPKPNPVSMGGPGSGDPLTDPRRSSMYFSAGEADMCIANDAATELFFDGVYYPRGVLQ